MATLLINQAKFDQDVWQDETDFTQAQYNEWVKNTAIPTLNQIYEDYEGNADVYILGDVINLLSNMEIKLDKYWELKSK